ncbi:hypothetical protein EW146_g6405 [Bondarzewia mesenterica]|uniref:Anaphase-promoting complex subunit 4 WD40 domain-containing protein n=1 Tax=Bondarzewia mesenterica TaxID=1095465 RepID=A0A4S4LPA0_9AGAM|nr:hypothetical protein EW146_g6405 [Bondarzewia mesenterica]
MAISSDATTAPFLQNILRVPPHVTAMSHASSNYLYAGSGDGSVRIYRPPEIKVVKAIRGLGAEISSIACSKKKGSELGVWLACGRRILSFDIANPKMILSVVDASNTLDLAEDDEDLLNQIALDSNEKRLAFSTDSGTVGIVDLTTKKISRMKLQHNNICGSVAFIPDRPGEIVSGGYDSALLHFDLNQGTVLSRFDFAALPPSSGVSLSPPFVLAIDMSTTGILAAGTADGQLWLGAGGEKRPSAVSGKKKRSRKWEGLRGDLSFAFKIAEGPVVDLAFLNPTTLITCTLLGTITQHMISRAGDDSGTLTIETVWTTSAMGLAKVNAMAAYSGWITIGGFDKQGKGLVEMWRIEHEENPTDAPVAG